MLINAQTTSNLLILCRPHYQLRGQALFFLASNRPKMELSATEAAIWVAIQTPVTLADLRLRFSDQEVDRVIQEFWQNELCELAEQDFPASRRRILVIEPHADDAVLSVGGTLWQQRHECQFLIATMATRSNFTSYFTMGRAYFDLARVMDIRNKESELFANMIGGECIVGGMTDVVLRYHDADWSLEYFKKHKIAISVATSRAASNEEKYLWTQTIQRFLSETPSDEVWIPLGSPHSDHALTMNACVEAFLANPKLIAGRTIKIYQDVPYASRFPKFTDEMTSAFKLAGIDITPKLIPIGSAMAQKLRLTSIYASQFKMHAMADDVKKSALSEQSTQEYSELLWRINGLPKQLLTDRITPFSSSDQQQELHATNWLIRNKSAAKVRLLLLMPTGQWGNDFKLLSSLFPQAQFDIYASPEAVIEVNELHSDRVKLLKINNGAKAWVLLSLQLIFSQHAPSLFFSGERRMKIAKWLSMFWWPSDSIVVSSMDRVVNACHKNKLALESNA